MKNGQKRSNPIPDTIKKVKNSELDDKLFQIPVACSIFNAETIDEFILLQDVASIQQQRRLGYVKKAEMEEKFLKKEYGVSKIDKILDQCNN